MCFVEQFTALHCHFVGFLDSSLSPGGMVMPGRSYSAGSQYRYGFNGKEKDADINSLTAYDYGFRIYNPALGKFLSVDPLMKRYPMLSAYQYCSNRPIDGIDLDGTEYLPVGTALYKFVGGITVNYKFNMQDAFITNVDKHNIIMGIEPVSMEATTNPMDKDGKVNWEETHLPKRSHTRKSSFSIWYDCMFNFNRQTLINGNDRDRAAYARPYSDGGSPNLKGATVLSAIFEIKSIIEMYVIANFHEKYSTVLTDIRNSAAAFDNAVRLVSAAVKHNGLPEFLLQDDQALRDLTNWIIDGTTADPVKLSENNQIIAIWGALLMNNYQEAIDGRLFRPLEIIIHNGGKASDSDNTNVKYTIVLDAQIANPSVQNAIDKTKQLNYTPTQTKVQPNDP